MFKTMKTIALATTMLATAGIAQAAERSEALWFTDTHTTASYFVHKEKGEVTVLTKAGPKGNQQASEKTFNLGEGESQSVTVEGYGRNAITAKLTATREEGQVRISVQTVVNRPAVLANLD